MENGHRENYHRDYRRTIKGVITEIFKSQKASSKRRGHKPPDYTKEEFTSWLIKNNIEDLHKKWIDSGYYKQDKPSVDRIDISIGYNFDNIRLVTWRENLKLETERQKIEFKGSGGPKAKSKEYYTTHKTLRSNFKMTCKNRGWIFDDFIEIRAGFYDRKIGNRERLYIYEVKNGK